MYRYEEFVGSQNIIAHFKNAISLNKVSHGYIIQGPKGSGKKTLAYTFAKSLQCIAGGDHPCEECISCKQAESGNHPDIITVQKSKSSSISVEDIRTQLNSDMYIKPYQGPYKVYIIDLAEQMTIQAQNALLKTLEEPPAYGMIILLVSDVGLLLPTILSRCIQLYIRPLQDIDVANYLKKLLALPDYQNESYANFAQGNIGRALLLASSEEFNKLRDFTIQLMIRLPEMEAYEILNAIKSLEPFKTMRDDFLEFVLIWYRDLLLVKALNNSSRIIYKEHYNSLLKQAKEIAYNSIGNAIDGINQTKQQLSYNVNFDLAIEMMLFKIKGEITW